MRMIDPLRVGPRLGCGALSVLHRIPQASSRPSKPQRAPATPMSEPTTPITPDDRQQQAPSVGDGGGDEQQPTVGVHINMPPPGPRAGSVQRLLEKEGPDARNVVSWLVPNRTGGGGGGGGVGGGAGGGSAVLDARTGAGVTGRGLRGERRSREVSRERENVRRKSPVTSPFKGSNGSLSSKGTPTWRGNSSSDSTTHGFNQRLWGYLFRNVNRAVDELYYLCEAEGSATHCTEAAELLEGCGRDFMKLVERIADQTRFEEEQRAARAAEKLHPDGEGRESSAESNSRKPKGLVWEVRKTTSSSSASAMVLNAIERMESHASPKDHSTGGGRSRTVPVSPVAMAIPATSLSHLVTGSNRYGGPFSISSRHPESLELEREYGGSRTPNVIDSRGAKQTRQRARSEHSSGDAAAISFSCLDDSIKRGWTSRGSETPTVVSETAEVAVAIAVAVAASPQASTASMETILKSDGGVTPEGFRASPDEEQDVHQLEARNTGTKSADEGSKVVTAGKGRVGSGGSGEATVRQEKEWADGGSETGAIGRSETALGVGEAAIIAGEGFQTMELTKGVRPRAAGLPAVAATGVANAGTKSPRPRKADSRVAITARSTPPTAGAGGYCADNALKRDQRSSRSPSHPTAGSTEADVGSQAVSSPQTRHTVKRLNPCAAPFTFNPSIPAGAEPSARNVRVHAKPSETAVTELCTPCLNPATVECTAAAAVAPSTVSPLTRSSMAASRAPEGDGNKKDADEGERGAVAAAQDCRAPRADHAVPPQPPPRPAVGKQQLSESIVVSKGDTAAVEQDDMSGATAAAEMERGGSGEGGGDGSDRGTQERKPPKDCENLTSEERSTPAAPGRLPPDNKWSRRPRLTQDAPGARQDFCAPGSPASLPERPACFNSKTVSRDSRAASSAARKFGLPNMGEVLVPSNGAGSPLRAGTGKVAELKAAESPTIVGRRRDGRARALTNSPVVGSQGKCGKNASGRARRRQEREEAFPCSGGVGGRRVDGVEGQPRRRGGADGTVKGAARSQQRREHADGVEDGTGIENECEDADSAYVTAMEKIWAEAEAWVDAEAQAEEEAWARLPADLPCPSESEGVFSDAEEACEPSLGAGKAACDQDETELEIEIPAVEEVEAESEGAAAVTEERRQGVEMPGSEEVDGQSLNYWYGARDRRRLEYEDDEDEDDMEDKEHRARHRESLRQGDTDPRDWSSPKSSKSPACPPANESSRYDPLPCESDSGVSYFGNERGSNDTLEEGWVPFSHRELQKKLSSPQRKPQRKILSAEEAKLRQERRQMVAELNRAQLANGMAEKLKQHEERVRGVRFRKEEQLLKAEEEARRKMEGADARRQEHRRGIVRKANDANSKGSQERFPVVAGTTARSHFLGNPARETWDRRQRGSLLRTLGNATRKQPACSITLPGGSLSPTAGGPRALSFAWM